MDDFLRDFLNDTREDLDKIDTYLIEFEKEFNQAGNVNYDTVNTLFRHFHSIKGSSGFFELKEFVRVAHAAENILDLLRKNQLEVKPDYLDVLFKAHDFIGILVESVEQNGNDKGRETEADSLIAQLKQLEKFRIGEKEQVSEPEKPSKFGLFATDEAEDIVILIDADNEKPVGTEKQEDVEEIITEEVKQKNFGLFADETETQPKIIENTNTTESLETVAKETEKKPEKNWGLFAGSVAEKKEAVKEKPAAKKIEQTPVLKDIRIGTDKLDSLMDLVGELVIVEAMVSRYSNDDILNIEQLRRSSSQLNKVVRYLQEIALSMRMVSVSGLFQKMSRFIRDLSRKADKQIQFVLHGEETEIDKTIIEQLSDPLVHIIRNAIDHGMETTEERKNTSKPAMGTITLEALHKGNEIWIVIKDDGRGLNREKILEKAKKQNLLPKDFSEDTFPDEKVWDLIFHPGFSTADKLTDISGRGVGMDVVKKNLIRLKGKIDIKTVKGEGTSFYLRIPLTLAIIDAMVVKFSGKYYIIPTENIDRFIDLSSFGVSEIHDHQKLIKLNEQLISVINLNEVFEYKSQSSGKQDGRIAVIVTSNKEYVAITLDEIVGSQQVVVKPLAEQMEDIKGFSGSAILGDGEVGVILDTEHIVKLYSKIDETEKVSR